MFPQALLNGAIGGLVLAVLALGFSLVYLPCRVFHIAMGGVYALTPYVAITLLGSGWSWPVVVVGSLLIAVLTSLFCEVANHRWLVRRQAASGAHLIASLGIYIVIVQVIAIVWGNDPQTLRKGVDLVFHFAGERLTLTRGQLVAGLIAALMLISFYFWLRLSQVGLRFRALADNPIEFALLGYNVNVYRLLAFGLSGFLVGVAALLTANDVGFDPHGGLPVLVLAVVAVIIGGRGTLLGPVLGGLLLGIVRAGVVWYFSARWQDVATFLILGLFLYLRPQGLSTRQGRLEAEI